MTRQSSHTMTYRRLLDHLERNQKRCQGRYDEARAKGVSNMEPLVGDLEEAKTLVRIFRKYEPGKQTDLFGIFETLKK